MYNNSGSRWRDCAQCGAHILVNVGSEDDRARQVLCRACAGEVAFPTVLITLEADGSVLRGFEFLAGVESPGWVTSAEYPCPECVEVGDV